MSTTNTSPKPKKDTLFLRTMVAGGLALSGLGVWSVATANYNNKVAMIVDTNPTTRAAQMDITKLERKIATITDDASKPYTKSYIIESSAAGGLMLLGLVVLLTRKKDAPSVPTTST